MHTALGAPFRRLLLAPLLFSMACSAGGLDDVISHVDAGEFKAARVSIDRVLAAGKLTSDERGAFEFEAERMRRIELDFSLSEQQDGRSARSAPAIRSTARTSTASSSA
ncbi:MAG: hypothetical protein ACREXP_27615, partial [Steroidobacteraceae bacterium]